MNWTTRYPTRGLIIAWAMLWAGAAWQSIGATAATRVIVDVRQGYAVNGFNEIRKEDFGVTSYQGATRPVTPTGQAILRQAGVTVLGFPGQISWCAPIERPPDGIAGIKRWYESEEARRMIRDRPLNGDRYEYGRILPACRQMGIEPMIYLLGGPKWILGPEGIPAEADEQLYASLVVEYVGLLRTFDPKLRLFHLGNEPNAHWWKAGKSGKDYGKLFAIVAKALHQRFPDALIGGPVLLWPPAFPPSQTGQENWYTWPSWTVPFLDSAKGQYDFFDFHHYDQESREDRSEFMGAAEEEVNLICNEMTRRGKFCPVAITECGVGLTEDDWSDPAHHWLRRTYPWAQFLMAMLDMPDKVMTVQMHDLSAVAGQWYKFLEDDNDGFNMSPSVDPGKLDDQPPTYWLYWLLRHSRGKRLVATTSGTGDLRYLATRSKTGSGDEASVFVINRDSKPQLVDITFSGVPASNTTHWEKLWLNPDEDKIMRESGSGAAAEMAPRSLAVFFTKVAERTRTQTTRERIDICGDTVLQEFVGDTKTVTIPIQLSADALEGTADARLAIGIQGSTSRDAITMTLDGEQIPLKSGTYWQEMPLRKIPPAGAAGLEFVLKHREGTHRIRISCVILRLEKTMNTRQ